LTNVTTFHDLQTTLTTLGDDILMTLTTPVEDTLTTLMSPDEDTLRTCVTTCDYFVTTLCDITDDPCDDIDEFEQITIETKCQQG